MIKTLLVNCYLNSTKIAGLHAVLEKISQCTVVPYGRLDEEYQIAEDIDSVVLSGSEARIVKAADKSKYAHVIPLIKTCSVPLLGICFGHQLLCSAFGAKTDSLAKPVIDRFEQVYVINADYLFSGFNADQTVPLAEYHNDYVLKEGLETAGFTLLADSASCEVEAVKHVSKPFWGVQFHPERIAIKGETHPDGHRVIENFYRTIVKR
jgi:GMP synthase-like glutamine amidotransferase